MAVKITGADRGTPAEQAGLAGATLLSIAGNEINDMLDYEFFSSGPKLELALVRARSWNMFVWKRMSMRR